MADALSIEQNNRIRAALGLKPLPVPGADNAAATRDKKDSGSSSEEEEGDGIIPTKADAIRANENWKKLQEEVEAKRRREEKREAIKRARDAARRNMRLEGKSLGEMEGADMDTKTWLAQHKKLQKKVEKERARRLAEELAERDRVVEYTSADLAGIKVAHDIADFEGAEEQILTLKDATIDELEAEGEELENIELREKEKLQERLELKKRKTPYDPTAEDGSGTILGQYDEVIEGKKRKRFTLDAQGSAAAAAEEEREAKRQDISSKIQKQLVSLDITPEAPVSDYMDVSEVKIKKPKKKKAKSTRQKSVDEDDIFPITVESTETPNGDSMDVEQPSESNGEAKPAPQKKHEDMSFVDDEDLQASLAMQRRAAFKKRKKVRPEDIARQLREEGSQTPMEVENGGDAEEEPGLVIDETSAFVSNLQKPTLPERKERPSAPPAEEAAAKREESPDEDVDMERSYNAVEDEEELKERAKQEELAAPPDISTTGLEEEKTLDQGLGATLAMLRQRGLVQPSDAAEKVSLYRDRQRFLQEKYRREAEAERRARQQRERDRASGKLDRMSARDREEYARWENRQRDVQESRQMADIFNREYKPDVQLKYVDEFGRHMTPKEAFKHLSHQFHGKGPGNMKTEKRLKKIEEEKKREAMSALDSSQNTGMNHAMGAAARRSRQAGVRLA